MGGYCKAQQLGKQPSGSRLLAVVAPGLVWFPPVHPRLSSICEGKVRVGSSEWTHPSLSPDPLISEAVTKIYLVPASCSTCL